MDNSTLTNETEASPVLPPAVCSAAFPLITGPCGGLWCIWAADKIDAYLWGFHASQKDMIDGFVRTLNEHVLRQPNAPAVCSSAVADAIKRIEAEARRARLYRSEAVASAYDLSASIVRDCLMNIQR